MAFLASVGKGIRNSVTGTAGFFRGSYQELKKVRWPSRREMMKYTLTVLATVVIITLFFFVIDLGIAKLVQIITK
ncbi:preprotein translocase subunit SecE [Seinonella peptonophila]|uniref:Protein translocase subunit SecE n=1 Tax=Seinonella peptonophila TaxID=112248 RepID=A0A1M4YV40_9BACL|nr:preprotein translocase subunit SecE [Seinonella peptonophila]SHF09437.1 preprotein translocase subunit SecE [Seinonella peptonophila]